MESVLRSLNQWEIVMGTIEAPTRLDPTSPTAQELQLERAWDLRKERAYSEIDLRVEDQQRVSIRENRDPRLAWDTLHTVYRKHLADKIPSLLIEIAQAQYDGTGILEHKSNMDTLRMKLIEGGYPVSDSLYLDFFVSSLPEEYDTLMMTINYDTDTADKVVSKIYQIETRRSLRTGEGSALWR